MRPRKGRIRACVKVSCSAHSGAEPRLWRRHPWDRLGIPVPQAPLARELGMATDRPEQDRFHNGGRKDALPFAEGEYHDRLAGLRDIMEMHGLDAVVLTSMHNVAYYWAFSIAVSGGLMRR